jgi:hypothetical protein
MAQSEVFHVQKRAAVAVGGDERAAVACRKGSEGVAVALDSKARAVSRTK